VAGHPQLGLSLQGEVNGRFVNVRGENGASSPSIETVYTNATAPGLSSQPGFVQLGQGFRIKPDTGRLSESELHGKLPGIFCALEFDEFVSALDRGSDHTIYLYGNAKSPRRAAINMAPIRARM